MFLACVELAARDEHRRMQPDSCFCGRVIKLEFSHLETACIWAEQEAARHRNATGNAVVFEAMGPFLSVAWEMEAKARAGADETESPRFHRDELVERA